MPLERLSNSDPGGTHARLYLRTDSQVLPSQREAHVRLDRLAREDVIDSFDVSTWANRVNLQAPHADETRREYERFLTWATRNDARLGSAFTVRDGGTLVDDSFDELLTPMRCLVVEDGADLAGVFPSVVDGTRYSVEDALSALEAREPLDDRPTDALATRGDD